MLLLRGVAAHKHAARCAEAKGGSKVKGTLSQKPKSKGLAVLPAL
jgi:hypothetical protein